MKTLRSLMLAAGLTGAGFVGGQTIDLASVPNHCNAPWEGQRSTAPADVPDESHFANEGMLVCRHPDGSEITFMDSGRVFGFDASGAPLTDAVSVYEGR